MRARIEVTWRAERARTTGDQKCRKSLLKSKARLVLGSCLAQCSQLTRQFAFSVCMLCSPRLSGFRRRRNTFSSPLRQSSARIAPLASGPSKNSRISRHQLIKLAIILAEPARQACALFHPLHFCARKSAFHWTHLLLPLARASQTRSSPPSSWKARRKPSKASHSTRPAPRRPRVTPLHNFLPSPLAIPTKNMMK